MKQPHNNDLNTFLSGILGVIGAAMLLIPAKLNIAYVVEFNWLFAILGFLSFATALSLHIISILNTTKKRSLIVKFSAIVLLFIFAWFAFPLHALIFFDSYYFLILFLPLPLHALHLIKVSHVQKPAEFDPELKKIALSSFLFSALLWLTVYFLDVSQ